MSNARIDSHKIEDTRSFPHCELMEERLERVSDGRSRAITTPSELFDITPNDEGSRLPGQVARLTNEVLRLKRRLSNVEKKINTRGFTLRSRPSFLQFRKVTETQENCKPDSEKPEYEHTESEDLKAWKNALSTMNRTLITSRPYNLSYKEHLRSFFTVMRRNHFAICHCFFMILAITSLLLFGCIKFEEAYNSAQTEFKPFKIKVKDEFQDNEHLHYSIPLHYFVFEMEIWNASFDESYSATFNKNCTSGLQDCLTQYFDSFLTAEPMYMPTMSPTISPTISPTSPPTPSEGYGPALMTPTLSPIWKPGSLYQQYSTNTSILDGTPFYAGCMMTSSEDETVITTETGIQNFTHYIDMIGVKDQRTVFGMLIKIELEDFEEFWDGYLVCNLNIDMELFNAAFSNFSKYDINFMVSRVDYDSATSGVIDDILSKKKVWRNTDESMEKLWTYVYEESTYDEVSQFSVDVFVEKDVADRRARLYIETYPYHTVVHWVSYARYSYTDWIADLGGVYTLVIGAFFILSARVTFFANRNDAFHRRHGILPAFSLTYRNAEELSGLRYLVLSALGISEEEYFHEDFQKLLEDKLMD